MKIIIEQAALVAALDHIDGIVEKRNTIPILANIKVSTGTNKITLVATDLDIELTETVACDVQESGETTMPAHLLRDIVRKYPKGAQVCLAADVGGSVTITSGRAKATVSTLPKEDFPTLQAGAFNTVFDIGAPTLRNLIEKVSQAISTEETRYYLNGIYLCLVDGNLRGVATDGHRLIRHDADAPAGLDEMAGVIIPRKTCKELRDLIGDYEGDIQVSVSGTKVRFEWAGTVLLSKLIDGNFPPYDRVIPKNNENILSIATKDICGVIDRCGALLQGSRCIRMEMTSKNTLFTAQNPGAGEISEDADSQWSGPDMQIAFNHRYLGDMLGRMSGENIEIAMGDSGSPVTMRDADDKTTLYVLMPMRG